LTIYQIQNRKGRAKTTEDNMAKYENTRAVAAKRDKSQWELGDAINDDIGKPPSDDTTNDGSHAILRDMADVLAEEGYDYEVKYLAIMRNIAHKFPPHHRRLRCACWEVHRLAQSPEMLDLITKSARLKDGDRLTFRRAKVILEAIKNREDEERQREHEKEREAAKSEGRRPMAPPKKSHKTVPPRNTAPVPSSKIAETAALHEIMALIARCQAAEEKARTLLEKHAFVPEAYDALVEQSLVVANGWSEFSVMAGKSQRKARGHLYAVNS
jgi:hypothetical protein